MLVLSKIELLDIGYDATLLSLLVALMKHWAVFFVGRGYCDQQSEQSILHALPRQHLSAALRRRRLYDPLIILAYIQRDRDHYRKSRKL